MGGFVLWIFLALIVGKIGSFREIGFWRAFILGMLLSPVIGIIFALTSPTLASVEYKQTMLNEQRQTNWLLNERREKDIAGNLERLGSLRDSNVISQEEFETLKAKEMAK